MPIDPTSLGARPRPSKALPPTTLSKLSADALPDDLPGSIIDVDEINGAAYATGFTRMRHVSGNMVVYPTGLLGPATYDGDENPDTISDTQVTSDRALFDWALNGTNLDAYAGGRIYISKGQAGQLASKVGSMYFDMQFIDANAAFAVAYGRWQVKHQADPRDTLQAIVDAITGNVATKDSTWREPNVADASYWGPTYDVGKGPATDPHPNLTAEIVDEDTLRVSFLQEGDLYNDNQVGGFIGPTFMQTASALSTPTLVTPTPVVPVEWPTGAEAGSPGHVTMFTGTDADLQTGAFIHCVDSDSGSGNAYFRIAIRAVLGFPDQYWQVVAQGTVIETLRIIELMFRGIADANWQGPNTANIGYDSVGLDDFLCEPPAGNENTGASCRLTFWTKTVGLRKNDIWIYQNCLFAGSPVPANNAYIQFSGGSDPIPGGRIGLDMPGDGTYLHAPGFYRKADKGQSAIGRPFETDNEGGGPITVVADNIVSIDPGVDYIRMWRTLQNGLGDFFKVEDVPAPMPADGWVDDYGDAEIAGTFTELLYNPRQFRTHEAGYPPKYRNLVNHLGSAWGAGISRSAPQLAKGDVTKGSVIVTIDAPIVVTKNWVGRYANRDDETKRYLIVNADPVANTVQISKPYEGEDGTTVDITVRDERRATKVGRAEPGQVNQWPSVREWHGIDTIDENGVVALAKTQLRLFLWTKNGTWVLHGNAPQNFALDPVGDGIGALNHRCMIVHTSIAYWLEGPEGFYMWAFEGKQQNISNPEFGQDTEPYGIQGTIDRINWEAAEGWAHGIADADGRRIRWWVPVDGSEIPNMCIILDLKSMGWSTETCEGITAACKVTLPNGELGILVGDVFGNIWHLDVGDSDGFYEIDPVVPIAAGSTVGFVNLTVDVSSRAIPGVPFIITYATGEVASGIVAKATASGFEPYTLLKTVPAAGDKVTLGPIDTEIEPNRFNQGIVEEEKSVPILWIYTSQGTGEYYLKVAVDHDPLTDPVYDDPVGDAGAENGIERFRVNLLGNQHVFNLRSFVPGTKLAFRRFEMQTQFRDNQKVPQ